MVNDKKAELRIQTLFQQYCTHMQEYSQILLSNLHYQSKYKIFWFKEVMLGIFLKKKKKTSQRSSIARS